MNSIKSALLRQLIALPLLLASMFLLYVCSNASGMASNGRGEAAPLAAGAPMSALYVLGTGDSVRVAPAAAAHGATGAATAPLLRLERVNDSRCRAGAVCVWAGYISYSFSLTGADGASTSFVLAEDMPTGSKSVTQNGVSYTLAGVAPAAAPALNDAPPAYRVSLLVSTPPR